MKANDKIKIDFLLNILKTCVSWENSWTNLFQVFSACCPAVDFPEDWADTEAVRGPPLSSLPPSDPFAHLQNSSDNLAFSILRIRESHTHTHTPSPKYTHSFLERSLFFLLFYSFTLFLLFFFFFLIKYTTTVSNEMELDNVIYLRMSFHYRKNLR